MVIIDGKKISNEISEQLKSQIALLKTENIVPKLVIIQIGSNPASNVYVRNKIRLGEKLGVKIQLQKLLENITNDDLLVEIQKFNNDKSINGILVQMPLPPHINEANIIAHIDPSKDVDCFHLENIGKLWTARKLEVHLKPCTPAGIIELLKHYNIKISEQKAVVVGRSNIVGKPMASLLLLDDATVTLCHSKTQRLHEVCKEADILICAVGKANMIDSSYVKPGATVIDVGMNHDVNNQLCGDVDFKSVSKIASHITPVPGGVGPMTVTMLMKNLIELTKLQNHLLEKE
ncbi:MAG: bifunctional methylenetetrahydrofolate dehydrogenase/methenyltetrahydrofolate cyclohydrolase [Mycoplasmataceae bacterium]|jgi:methylenetetrahydrofolate dehydrogenase (NADP+)/methenyltetrahydrofolate cyclohydrolase|nr:bifunctional methylenetetrahydrofolate dehydrogenase/methenyltetrahydrofolate cyclohydrolase [Mycoplasmataceae bacterium]